MLELIGLAAIIFVVIKYFPDLVKFLIKFLIVNQCAHVALEPVLLDLWSVILSQLAQGVKSR